MLEFATFKANGEESESDPDREPHQYDAVPYSVRENLEIL
jgi:hypothetical protein